MQRYGYQNNLSVGRVCLELSLKPFGYDKTIAGWEAAARDVFTKWKPLTNYATGVSVLFWTADGSEIFEYTGNLDDEFEWARYIGIGNWDKSQTPDGAADQNDLSMHKFPLLYKENPPKMTYGDLRGIIAAVKRVGKEVLGVDVEVGETFDPGPEFAYSWFKYERHPEIASGICLGKKSWVHCASRLHAEDRAYAAYPNGIPEGTHLGEFLGRQFMAMRRDLGFDYIWLSNGFGFSLQSWNWVGELFNGKEFNFAGADRIRENISEFWRYFLAEIGDTRIETRGSNLSTGMDISAPGCPIDEIYAVKNLVSPPNSPWAALDSRFGLELTGYMSHIAEIPEKGFAFRYYTHDPWWQNSPWFDRYNRSPHDIYLPLSVARLDENCGVTHPFSLDFLSIDDSYGRAPDRCNVEVIPHLLTAFNDYPDAPGLVTWVYPFDEYCRLGLREGRMERLIMDDWFMESGIDFGFPVNSVISDKNFIKADKKKLLDTILVTPVPQADSALEAAILDALEAGAKIILFGSTVNASDKLRARIGVALTDAIDGEMTVATSLKLDTAEINGYADKLVHVPLVSNGGIAETACGAKVLASVKQDGTERAYVTERDGLVWIRGSFPHQAVQAGHLPPLRTPAAEFPPALFLRAAMQVFGYALTFECFDINTKLPLIMFSKCREALWLNMFAKDTTVRMYMTTPDGAPAPNGSEFVIDKNVGRYATTKWMHTDCRVYIRQEKRGLVKCRIDHVASYLADENYYIDGLEDATVTIFPTKGGKIIPSKGNLWASPCYDYTYDEARGCYVIPHVTGSLRLGWVAKENIDDWKKLDFLGVSKNM